VLSFNVDGAKGAADKSWYLRNTGYIYKKGGVERIFP
jgi:hypothetical protein